MCRYIKMNTAHSLTRNYFYFFHMQNILTPSQNLYQSYPTIESIKLLDLVSMCKGSSSHVVLKCISLMVVPLDLRTNELKIHIIILLQLQNTMMTDIALLTCMQNIYIHFTKGKKKYENKQTNKTNRSMIAKSLGQRSCQQRSHPKGFLK